MAGSGAANARPDDQTRQPTMDTTATAKSISANQVLVSVPRKDFEQESLAAPDQIYNLPSNFNLRLS